MVQEFGGKIQSLLPVWKAAGMLETYSTVTPHAHTPAKGMEQRVEQSGDTVARLC